MTMKIPTKQLLEAINLVESQSCDTLTVTCNEEGWTIYCIDPSHVSLAYIVFSKAFFTDYEELPSFSVACSTLKDVLKAHNTETISFEVSNGRVTITGGGMVSKLSLDNFVDIARKFPNLEPEARAETDASVFEKVFQAAKICGSHTVTIQFIDKDSIKLTSENDTGEGSVVSVPADDCSFLEGNAVATYDATMLKAGLGAFPKGALITLSFSTDTPLIASWAGANWSMKWMLAPQIIPEEV